MKSLKFYLTIAILFTYATRAQNPLSIQKIRQDNNLKTYEYKSNVIGGVIKEIPYTFHIKYDDNSLIISFLTTSAEKELWGDKKLPEQEYINYIMREYITLLKKVHVTEELQNILNIQIAKKDYELNPKTGRLFVFTNSPKYEEISLEVLHTGYFSYIYNVIIRW
ncbi:hypothetical protein ACLI09_17925 [Flavobacterium sp. RHBU_24]|uniref:hypothetical protein n=1 Tax=Flavobacterium sp. RHBU_24 TaxID=3391185 RepID=UPI003984DC30